MSTALSHTKRSLIVTCPEQYRLRYKDRAPELASEPAETGNGLHSIGEHSLENEETLLRLLLEKAALLDEAPAADLRAVVRRYLERGGFPALPSDATDVAHEQRMAVDSAGQVCAWDAPEATYRGILDRVYTENEGTLLVIDDWKSGRVIESPGEQMRGYAYLGSALFPEVTDIVVRLHYVRFNAIRTAKHLPEQVRHELPIELAVIAAELARRERDDDWEPRVGSHCLTRCGYRARCSAFAGEVKPLVAVDTQEQAATAHRQLVVLQGQVKDVDAALRGFARMHGPIDLGTEVRGYMPSESSTVPDANKAARVLQAKGVDKDVIWAALKLPKVALDKLVTKVIAGEPRTRRGAAREEVEQELADLGALVTKTTTKWKSVKKTVEDELDDEDEAADE